MNDFIADFEVGVDKFDLSSFNLGLDSSTLNTLTSDQEFHEISGHNVKIWQATEKLVITIDTQSIILANIQLSDITPSLFA